MQGWTANTTYGVARKRSTKRLKHTCLAVNSKLKAIRIIGQVKAFYRQRTPEFRCMRKETVDIDIFIISKNGDRKIICSIRITSRPPSRIRKWHQLSLFRWTSSKIIPIEKTYASYISKMTRGFKRGSKWKDQHYYISVFVAYVTIPSSS